MTNVTMKNEKMTELSEAQLDMVTGGFINPGLIKSSAETIYLAKKVGKAILRGLKKLFTPPHRMPMIIAEN